MKLHLPSLLAGLLIGALGAALSLQPLVTRRVQAERDRINERIAAAVTEAEADHAATGTNRPANNAASPDAPRPDPAPARPLMNSNMLSQVSLFMRSQMESELAALKLRLRLTLTPEQEARLASAMDETLRRQGDMTRKLMAGEKLSGDELSQAGGTLVSWEKVLEEMLTPEQKTGYEAFQKEKINAAREQMAQMQLTQAASLLGLSEEQKDKVYSVFYEHQDFMGMKDLPPGDMNASGIAKYMEANLQKTREKLQGILSPEQLDLWTRQQQRQLELQRQMMERSMPAPKPDKL